MTAAVLAVPAAFAPSFGAGEGPFPLSAAVLAEFPGSVALGIAFHVGVALLALILAVRWASDASGAPKDGPTDSGERRP